MGVFDKMETLSLAFLAELETLLRLLLHTHAALQSFCPLPPFAAIVSRCCGSAGTTAGANPLNPWLQRETMDLLCFGVFDVDQKVGVVMVNEE